MDGILPRRLRLGLSVAFLLGALRASTAVAEDYSILYSFTAREDIPSSAVVAGPDGRFYGVTRTGGALGLGSVYTLTPDGNGGYSFADLFEASQASDGVNFAGAIVFRGDGKLYGTAAGGDFGFGVLYRISTSGTYEKLFSCSEYDCAWPYGLLLGSDGSFYGTTATGGANLQGAVYRFDPPSTVTLLHSFIGSDGDLPNGLFQAPDSVFYGATAAGGDHDAGTVFQLSPAGSFLSLHSFAGADGYDPSGLMALGTDGYIYGIAGGGNAEGVAFKISPGGAVTTVRVFSSTDPVGGMPTGGLMRASNGKLYGTTLNGGANGLGTVFSLSGATAAAVADLSTASGTSASVPAELVTGHLFAATGFGGDGGLGTVFDCPFAGPISAIHTFYAAPEGFGPLTGLLELSPGIYYGAAARGGPHGYGTLFRIDAPGALTVTHAFDGTDGGNPLSTPTFGADGRLYGTSAGSVFAIDLAGTFDLIHLFGPYEGYVRAGLLSASDGNLYGLADTLGAFRVTTSDGFSVFGAPPRGAGALVESAGAFLGATTQGGLVNSGTVFRMDAAGAVTTLHDFRGPDGEDPHAGLALGADGAFYGTTYSGGRYGGGTVYRLDASGQLRTIYDFGRSEAGFPSASLLLASDGFLYGTTEAGGPTGFGAVYRVDFSGTGFSVVHAFSSQDGAYSDGSLIQASDGSLVGTTFGGGPNNGGVVFRLGLPPSPLAVSGILPAFGPPGGGANVAVAGAGFVDGATVAIGGSPASGVSRVAATELLATTPALAPGTLNDVAVTNPDATTATLPGAFVSDFLDVPEGDIFHDDVVTIFLRGITGGCGGGLYCRDAPVSRAQMAAFLLKAEHGASHVPPACTGIFSDVVCPGPFSDWIEELSIDGITAGCGPDLYCPDNPVTRQQMAVFLLKTANGATYVPPPCIGIFGDVPCSSPFAPWVEELYKSGVSGGCSSGLILYCPQSPTRRGQMAVFLVKTFGLF